MCRRGVQTGALFSRPFLPIIVFVYCVAVIKTRATVGSLCPAPSRADALHSVAHDQVPNNKLTWLRVECVSSYSMIKDGSALSADLIAFAWLHRYRWPNAHIICRCRLIRL